MKEISRNQSGAVLVTFAILLVALLGFAALATEAGRWYLVRSELSKAVDAAAMAGAKNISNPFVTVDTLAQEVGDENFPAGQLGTPVSGEGSISFTTTVPETNKVQVVGRVSAIAILARLFGIERVASRSSGVAQKKEVEIMMVLDRSGSMSGSPISDLKTAAKSFLSFFTETQDEDKMGLISFATGVTVDQQLGTNFVNAMTTKINAMTAVGATNAEDAIDQSDGPKGFTDQTGIPGDQRVQQYLIFFTDGRPTAFRSKFKRNNKDDYDRVIMVTGNCDSSSDTIYNYMGYPDNETLDQTLPYNPIPTGDGLPTASTVCCSGTPPTGYVNTRWGSFSAYPVSGMGAEAYPGYCKISTSKFNGNNGYICSTARQMAIDHAQELKDKNIKIYTIGLSNNVNKVFLGQIASGPDYEFYTPNSSELEAIFQKVAKEIKLRLVE